MSKIQFITPHQCGKEKEYVNEAIVSNWIAPLGPYVNTLESNIKTYSRSNHCVVVNSGTSALHIVMKLLNIKKGDVVLCTDVTFIASILGAVYESATPIFIETNKDLSTNIESVKKAIKKHGKKIKACVITHLYGYADRNIFNVKEICKKHNIPLVEDAAETFGATINGVMTGTIGDYGVYSFNGNKIITTSGGGALVSSKHDLSLALHLSTQARESKIDYIHSRIGYNYRMSNISAALGVAQLETIDEKIKIKKRIYDTYKKGFSKNPYISLLDYEYNVKPNYWVSVGILKIDQSHELVEYLGIHDIEARLMWRPLHTQPVFAKSKYYGEGSSLKIYNSMLCLPSDPNMTSEQQAKVITLINKFLFINVTKKGEINV